MTCALWVAAAAFGVAVFVGLLVLMPWRFHGDMQASTLVDFADQGHARSVVERDLALRVERQYNSNVQKAAALQWGLMVIVLAVAVEFAALALQLLRSA